ncbi:MAG TPA: dienelactone hydrolase family protein [Chloroflexota bacterium]|nr:dienelactone hydrolase family protein [Chloroflexota bacterium]
MCFDDDARPPIPIIANTGARGKDIRLRAEDGTEIAAYLTQPGDAPRAQVVILPDVRGLHQFYRELAMRFAETGTRALAIDYFGRTAEDDDRTDAFEYMSHVQQMAPETFGQDLRAAVGHLRDGADSSMPTFTVGFCMGGSLSFWAGTQGLDLNGVVGFYASLNRSMGAVTPALNWADQIRGAVLGLFGGADQNIPAELVNEFEAKLEAAAIRHEIVIYPNAPHSFFDRRATEFAEASADAWNRVQGFIGGVEALV